MKLDVTSVQLVVTARQAVLYPDHAPRVNFQRRQGLHQMLPVTTVRQGIIAKAVLLILKQGNVMMGITVPGEVTRQLRMLVNQETNVLKVHPTKLNVNLDSINLHRDLKNVSNVCQVIIATQLK